MKFQGDMLNFCDFIKVFVFTRNHHLKGENCGQALLRSSLYEFHPIKGHRQGVVVAIVITVL